MKSILVLQHVPHETLGALESHFVAAGFPCRYLGLYSEVPERLDLDGAAGLVVLGGPMNVDEVDRYPFLGPEPGWIREAIGRGNPAAGDLPGGTVARPSRRGPRSTRIRSRRSAGTTST